MLFALAACGDELNDETRQDGGAQTEQAETAADTQAAEASDSAEQEEAEPEPDEAAPDGQQTETESEEADTPEDTEAPEEADTRAEELGDVHNEDGVYTTKEDVALYIHTYGHLPGNFITKKQAQNLGWSGGSLEPYAPGMCIGGSHFGNFEGLLPEAEGRSYTECDIDTLGASSRGGKRIVFSNDGLIYYTGDHYKSFELLYGDENQ
ncbi:MAG: ribonuclease [Oscillospiraceae bacterium]|nr:ribonuclease [Oscillospiraceae bacterium]